MFFKKDETNPEIWIWDERERGNFGVFAQKLTLQTTFSAHTFTPTKIVGFTNSGSLAAVSWEATDGANYLAMYRIDSKNVTSDILYIDKNVDLDGNPVKFGKYLASGQGCGAGYFIANVSKTQRKIYFFYMAVNPPAYLRQQFIPYYGEWDFDERIYLADHGKHPDSCTSFDELVMSFRTTVKVKI
jgi:hypothetical protein